MPGTDAGGLVKDLLSDDAAVQLQAVADLKHAIIGNRRKKLDYSSAGAVPILVTILRDGPSASRKGSRSTAASSWCASANPSGSQLAVHAAAALGSFSCGSSESSREVVAAGAIPPLCALLSSTDTKVVTTATRTLRIILDRDRWTACEQSPSASSVLFAETPTRLGVGPAQTYTSAGASAHTAQDPGSDEMVESNRSGRERREVCSAGGGRSGGEVGDSVCEDGEPRAGGEGPGGGKGVRKEQFVPWSVARLVELVEEGSEDTGDVAASILARACRTPAHQDALEEAGALDAACLLLAGTSPGGGAPKCQEAALDLLGALVRGRRRTGAALLAKQEGSLAALMRLVRDRRPATRLLACACVASLAESLAAPPAECWHDLLAVLHATVRLLSEPHRVVLEHAPEVLCTLLRCQPAGVLHHMVCEAGAVAPLVAQAAAPGASARQQELSFRALSLISADSDELRTLVACSGAVPLLRQGLSSAFAGVRIAACCALRSLSRSVHILRTWIADAEIAPPLCALLADPKSAAAATAALCNLLIAFSPARADALAAGVIVPLVAALRGELACGGGPVVRAELRLSAAWALRNLSFRADMETKQRMLSGLGGARVLGLVSGLSTDGEALSSDGEAVVHVLAMLRNLLHREPSTRSRRGTGKEETQATDKRGCHVEMVLKEVGCEALLESLAACIARPPCQEAATEALLAVANIAAGSPAHRRSVLASEEVMRLVSMQLLYPGTHDAARLAAMGCLWNLAGRRAPSFREPSGLAPRPPRVHVVAARLESGAWHDQDAADHLEDDDEQESEMASAPYPSAFSRGRPRPSRAWGAHSARRAGAPVLPAAARSVPLAVASADSGGWEVVRASSTDEDVEEEQEQAGSRQLASRAVPHARVRRGTAAHGRGAGGGGRGGSKWDEEEEDSGEEEEARVEGDAEADAEARVLFSTLGVAASVASVIKEMERERTGSTVALIAQAHAILTFILQGSDDPLASGVGLRIPPHAPPHTMQF